MLHLLRNNAKQNVLKEKQEDFSIKAAQLYIR